MLAITSFHQQLADQIDARQNELSVLRETARKIIAQGARNALNLCLRDDEVREFENTAQRYLDEGGEDDGQFEAYLDACSNPVGEGSDEDQFWRESAYAEGSLAA